MDSIKIPLRMRTPTLPKPKASAKPATAAKPKAVGKAKTVVSPAQKLPSGVGAQQSLPLAARASPGAVVGKTRDAPASVCPLLLLVLGWRRRHDTPSEAAFNDWLEAKCRALIAPHVGAGVSRRTRLKHVVVEIPEFDKAGRGVMSDVLFSCHVDTQDGGSQQPPTPGAVVRENGLRQKLIYDAFFGHIALDLKDPHAGGCLGADDGVGVWIMLRMIEAGVPGSYVFHRGEECGGISSNAAKVEDAKWLERHSAAIAFDRPWYDEVITHQGGVRCASDKFADALAKEINKNDPGGIFAFKPSPRGVFTDTKNYRGLIAECVNVGVGYERQHGREEFQDYGHAKALMEACLKVSWGTLPIDRDPEEDAWDRVGVFKPSAAHTGFSLQVKPPAPAPKPLAPLVLTVDDELEGLTLGDLEAMASDSPEDTARCLATVMADLAAARARVDALSKLLGL